MKVIALVLVVAVLAGDALPTGTGNNNSSSSSRPQHRRRKKYAVPVPVAVPVGTGGSTATRLRNYYAVKSGQVSKTGQKRTFVLYRPQTTIIKTTKTITAPHRVPIGGGTTSIRRPVVPAVTSTRVVGATSTSTSSSGGATSSTTSQQQRVHVIVPNSSGLNVTVSGGGIVQPKVTSVDRAQPESEAARNASLTAAAVEQARRASRRQQWLHSAKRIKSRKQQMVTSSMTSTADGRTLDKQDTLMVAMPKMKEKVRALHNALNSHRQRSRNEHKRIWKDIAKAKSELRRLQQSHIKLKRNSTNTNANLRRQIGEFNKHRDDVLFRIEDIERHQKTQDLRFFNAFESSQNNSADISELKEQVQTIVEQLEYMEQQKQLADNDTLMRIAATNKHHVGQLEHLRALSEADDPPSSSPQSSHEGGMEQPIFIEPAGYDVTEGDVAVGDDDEEERGGSYPQAPAGMTSSASVSSASMTEVIGSQAQVIKKQNKTIGTLVDRLMKQDKTMHNMLSDLEYQQEATRKLLTIVTNLGQQMRGPVLQYKDCHDLYLAGHQESGVYSIVRGMEMQPVFCNMTADGGWTVIQRRMDGTQDFDRDWKDYSNGFGSVYGEYWLGLETIRWLTHSRIYKIAFLITDWNDNQRVADYEQFLVYGQEYVLSVKGFRGDDDDDMVSASNGMPFRVRHQDRSTSITANAGCTATRRSGWWFPPDCGQANPNGPYSMSLLQPMDTAAGGVDYSVRNSVTPPLVRWLTWRNVTDFLKSITVQIMPSENLDGMMMDDGGGYNDFDLHAADEDVSVVDAN